ncbi:entericidin A/B family lipoprotein [Pantoea agglomerans]|nr:entericidin A/B family lipoprotein [Pantoea agglomerans]
MIKLAKLIAFALLVSSALSACNTFHGFGEDVSHLGGAISRVAK